MSGGADDGKGSTEPGVTPPAVQPPSDGSRQSEWTASDHRGPLRAPTETDHPADEVERFVPSSEVDAEGLRDEAVGTHGAVGADGEPHAGPISSEPIAPEPGLVEPSPAEMPSARTEPPVSTSQAARPAAAPRRSLWPVAAGLVIGSLIGAGSAAIVYNLQQGEPAVPPEVSTKLADLSSRLDGVEKRPDPQASIGDVRNEVHAVTGRVAALEKRPAVQPQAPQSQPVEGKPAESKPAESKPAPAAPLASVQAPAAPAGGDLAGKLATLQAALDGLSKQDGSRQAAITDLAGKLAALQGAIAQLQAASRSSADAAKDQQRDFDGKLAALQTAVSGAQKQAGAVQGDLAAVQGSVSAIQGNLAAVQGEQKTLTAKVGAPALAVAADSLVAQVEAGKPYASQVDALANLGADPARIAVLRENARAGVSSAQALAAGFAPLADPVIATGSKTPADANFVEQLKHGLFGLVEVRRADDTAGNGLASRVALLQADLAHNDVPGAYGVWDALPADAKAKSSAWGLLAKSSTEAIAAARGLQAQSIDTLAAKKS